MSERAYLIAKAEREKEKARPYLIAGGGIAGATGVTGAGMHLGYRPKARAAQRDADSANWLARKYSKLSATSLNERTMQGLSNADRKATRYERAASEFAHEARGLRRIGPKVAAHGLGVGTAVAGGGAIGVSIRNRRRDRKASLSKRDKSWKNISQYETERAQGRRTERHGSAAASLGATGALIGGELAAADPSTFGTPFRMKRQLKDLQQQRKDHAYQTREWNKLTGPLFDSPAEHAADVKRLKGLDRARTRTSLKHIARRNPATFIMAGGAGAVGTCL